MANGHVSITQGAMVLLAERVEYDRASDEVTASGNVSLLEETGNVYFADSMRLKRQLRVGVVQHFKARLADGSLLVANAAERKSDTLTELWQAAYTPCRIICNNKGEASDPLWSVDAHQATFDEGAEKIRYRDAVVRAYGLPVFYTPYFSHSTPGAPNESGILLPQYSFNNNLGSTASLPYYYVIDQSQDATLTPIYTSKEGLVMQGEYRRQFNNGKMKVDGSITNPQNRDAAGNLIDGNQVRGYFGANGDFTINEHWDWGFGIRRATDDTYLRRYFNNTEAFLSSRVFLEGHDFAVNERSFASAEGLAFQGLQAADDNDKIPIIFPLLNLSLQGNKDSLGGRWGVDANAMSLTRNDGAGSRRLASLTRYNLPYLTDSGQLLTLGAQMRSDIYSVDDVALSDGRNYNGTTGRLVPEVNALWRMPFEKRFESSASWVLEPTVGVALSPGGGNPEKLPNEDSQIPEFTDANLFDFNRFSGWDRIESGPRATYGLRSQYLFPTGQNITFVAGQHARLEPNTLFPFSNDLDSRLSDYVGKVGFEVDPFDNRLPFPAGPQKPHPQTPGGGFHHPLQQNLHHLVLSLFAR